MQSRKDSRMQWSCSRCTYRNAEPMPFCEACTWPRNDGKMKTYFPDPDTDETVPGADITYKLGKPEGSQPADKPPTKKELRKEKKEKRKEAKAKAKSEAKSSTDK